MNQEKRAHAFFASRLLAALLLIVAASDAAAQFGGSRRGTMGSDRNMRDTSQNRETRPAQDIVDGLSYETIEYRLTLLTEALRPMPAQAQLMDTFAAKVRAYAADVARQRVARMPPTNAAALQPGAEKHLAQAVDDARNRLAALEDIETAARALLSALTPEQRAIADLRIPTIVAPRPIGGANSASDLGAPRTQSGAPPAR